ncbi:hypothetical protein GO684_03225 [Wolbachia endosymbiont of Litomosoides brasiliensis]|nr:hypothetical protein [Wolbachia endosymbiont of Litomosoides brasiliensis]NUY39665.1 hypothetical protein [Wolbachia endosymbiont of Litomosoides brasiliensis]
MTARVKIFYIIKNSTNFMNEAPKIWKREKLFTSPQCYSRTRLNQSQFE